MSHPSAPTHRWSGHLARSLPLALLIGGIAAPARSDECEQLERQRLVADHNLGDWFGVSVAVDGDFLVAGAPLDDGSSDAAGSVSVFRFDGSQWVFHQQLRSGQPHQEDLFGVSVAIEQDVIVVGENPNSAISAAHVFRFDGTQWLPEQRLQLPAPDGEFFGACVAIHQGRIFVGAPLFAGNRGAAYVFEHDGVQWVQKQALTASDPVENAYFGWAFALDGDRALIGASGADGAFVGAGAVYVFEFDGSSWTQQAKLIAPDGGIDDEFGGSLALEGDIAVVGARQDDDACPSDPHCDSGSAHVFRHSTGSWSHEAKLVAADSAKKDRFGFSASIDQGIIAIGAPQNRDFELRSGFVAVFRRQGNAWVQTQTLRASNPQDEDGLGAAVAVFGSSIAAGAPQDYNPPGPGAVHVFDLRSAGWSSYGSGWPGTLGIPGLTLGSDPALGASPVLSLTNSAGASTLAFLLIGTSETSVATAFGGTLLVVPRLLLPVVVPFPELAMPVTIPADCALAGLSAFLQAVEQDAGASHGWSFTPGLQLTLGH